MGRFLGVDGGGTGCRAAVCDATGAVLGRAEAPAANIVSDLEGACRNIISAARGAAEAAGVGPRFAELPTVLGLAGANVASAAAQARGRLPFRLARIETDAVIALKGAFGTHDGVVAILGTGSIFIAQRDGVVETVGGWGFALGDHGSGAWLGRRLLERALLAHDRLAPATPLLEAVLREAGGPDALVAFAAGARPSDFARYAPRVFVAAAEGDAAAIAALAEADAAIVAAIARLRDGSAAPICFLGGLGPLYAARLQARYGVAIRAPRGAPVDGALAMARGAA